MLTEEPNIQVKRVIDIIRELVPRPTIKPGSAAPDYGTCLRFGACCPLGLLPTASRAVPINVIDAGLYGEVPSVAPFWTWWDSQNDADAAIEAIWGGA